MVMCIASKCALILCQMQFNKIHIRNILKNNVSKSVQVKHKLQGKEIVSMFHLCAIIFYIWFTGFTKNTALVQLNVEIIDFLLPRSNVIYEVSSLVT